MSSTNRNAERQPSDYYATPVSFIEAFLKAWHADIFPYGIPAKRILDPCAGGRKDKEGMSYPDAIKSQTALFLEQPTVDTIDIREDSRAAKIADWLFEPKPAEAYDLIITNPPFNLAIEIIQKALREVANGGHVVMLQRLNFLGSMNRFNFWHNNVPTRIYVHAERMRFMQHRTDLRTKERNATDSIEYAHFVWRAGMENPQTILRVI